jgi:hypothetical protein
MMEQTYWDSEMARRIHQPTTDEGLREAMDRLVVSSLVSSVYVRLRSLVFGSMRQCRSPTLTVALRRRGLVDVPRSQAGSSASADGVG